MTVANHILVDAETSRRTFVEAWVFTGYTMLSCSAVGHAGLLTTMGVSDLLIILLRKPIFKTIIAISTITSLTLSIGAPKFLVGPQELGIVDTTGGVDGEHLVRVVCTVSFSRPATWVGITSEVPRPVAVLVDSTAPCTNTLVVSSNVTGKIHLLLPEGVIGTQLWIVKAHRAICCWAHISSSIAPIVVSLTSILALDAISSIFIDALDKTSMVDCTRILYMDSVLITS